MSKVDMKTGMFVYPAALNENFKATDANFDELYVAQAASTAKAGLFDNFTTATTPASGTCAVQLSLVDSAGDALTTVQSGIGYLCDADGVMVTAATSIATLTNGSIATLVTGQVFQWVSKADGTLGVTLTADAETYYVALVKSDGTVVVSDALVVNA